MWTQNTDTVVVGELIQELQGLTVLPSSASAASYLSVPFSSRRSPHPWVRALSNATPGVAGWHRFATEPKFGLPNQYSNKSIYLSKLL